MRRAQAGQQAPAGLLILKVRAGDSHVAVGEEGPECVGLLPGDEAVERLLTQRDSSSPPVEAYRERRVAGASQCVGQPPRREPGATQRDEGLAGRLGQRGVGDGVVRSDSDVEGQ